jgi:hypothetical protein
MYIFILVINNFCKTENLWFNLKLVDAVRDQLRNGTRTDSYRLLIIFRPFEVKQMSTID